MENRSFVKKITINGSTALPNLIGVVDNLMYWWEYNSRSEFIIFTSNIDLQILSSYKFKINGIQDAQSIFINDIIKNQNNEILILGVIRDLNPLRFTPIVLCVDTSLDLKWSKSYFTNDDVKTSSLKIKRISLKSFVIQSGNLIFKIDSNGRLLKAVGISSSIRFNDFEVHNDQVYLIKNGYANISGSNFGSKNKPGVFSILRLNNSLEKVDTTDYFSNIPDDGSGGTSIIKKDNDLIIYASLKEKYYFVKIEGGASFSETLESSFFEKPLVTNMINVISQSSKLVSLGGFYYNYMVVVYHARSLNTSIINKFDSDFNLIESRKFKGTIDDVDAFNESEDYIFTRIHDDKIGDLLRLGTNFNNNHCIQEPTIEPIFSLTNENLVKVDDFAFSTDGLAIDTISLSESTLNIEWNVFNEINIIELCNIVPSLERSDIKAVPTKLEIGQDELSRITVQLKSESGFNIGFGASEDVQIHTTSGTLNDFKNNRDGTYTVDLLPSVNEETALLTFTIGAEIAIDTTSVEFYKVADRNTSTIIANKSRILANGLSTSTITVQLKDSSESNIIGNHTVLISTNGRGAVSNTTNNGNGTYTTELTSSTSEETATISFTIDSLVAADSTTVEFYKVADRNTSTIIANKSRILANGLSTSTITVQLKDNNGSNIIGDHTVNILTNGIGTVGNTINNEDGTYTAELISSSSEETATISFTIDSLVAADSTSVEFYKVADRNTSTIIANKSRILANGMSTSTITVQLKDNSGGNIIGNHNVLISTNGRGTVSNTTNNGNGTYTTELTSSTSEETATISFTIDSLVATDSTTVEFYKIASINTSTISASPTRILANGTSESTITVQLKDSSGANIIGSQLIKIFSIKGGISATSNNGDGTHTAVLTSSEVEETATVFFKIDTQFGTETIFVDFYKIASISTSTISASPTKILANGTSESTITVQLKDNNGTNIIGSQLIKIFSIKGDISATTNNGDGTYTAILTSSEVEETTTVFFKIDTQFGTETTFVDFYKKASLSESIISVSDPTLPANGLSKSIITIQLRDNLGNDIIGNHEVNISTNKGNISTTTNNNDGTFNAELTSSLFTETADITFTINGVLAQNSTQVRFYKEPDITATTIEANPPSILANGTAMTTVTVQLRDEDGTILFQPYHNVEISTSIGNISETIDNNDGSYMAMLTSTTEPTTAILSFTLNNVLSSTITEVRFVDIISITPTAQLQSPHIYLQAAGSTDDDGDQSTSGIHLRWTFKNKLGDEHLPKGNLATGTANFNKPGDYVKVYRAPYIKDQLSISLEEEPQSIDQINAYWLYTVNSNKYYVLFKDKAKYQEVSGTIDPRNGNRLGFLEAYGDGLIEIETRDQLAFGVTLTANQQINTSSLQTEILSVETNRLSLAKNVIGRKTFTGTALNDTHQCGDNIRSIRFKASNCYVTGIKLELYQTFLNTTNEAQNWEGLGDFSLTTSDGEAFQRLEGTPNTIHGKWPRYNNSCLTNIDNYRDKWNGPREEGDRNLKQIIEKYIELSNTEGNPRAVETIDFTDTIVSDGLRDLQEVSNLNMLFLAGTDYHMARMMGLGHLDVAIEDNDQKFVYMVEYHTEADLGGSPILGGGLLNPDGVQHLYMTVPTSKQDTRLPYPVDLLKIEPGIKRTGLDQNSTLTDPNGYTDVGRQRYLSIYAKEQVEHENESFYETTDEFNYSEATHPVYAGVSYKEKGAGNDWVKPEISSSADYLTAGSNPTSETVPLPIPLMGEPLFVHRVLEEGTHEYLGYGINWFGRSNISIEAPLEIRTEFPAINLLKPPTALHALQIVEEEPLILTSASEQERIDNNDESDPTMARLMFSYNHEQELISYPISSDDRALFTDTELLEPDVFRPDQNEIFANEIEVFFRDTIPQNIRGKILTAEDDSLDQAVSVLMTGDYTLYSEKVKNEETGEYEFVTIKPELPEGIPEVNFTGGVLILGQQQFIIHSVSTDSNGYAIIKVYKKAVGDALQGNTTEGPLESPDISGDEIFMAIENMLTVDSWGTGSPSSFKIQIPDEVSSIHRALIETSGGSDVNELLLEKFRGIYDDNVTITPVLETSEVDENNEETASIHRGTYKIQLSKTLTQHPQFSTTGNSVEWQGGSVRIPSEANPNGTKRTLKVVKIENVGTTDGLVLYAIDDTFDQEIVDPDTGKTIRYESTNPIRTTGDIAINFYPGYKVYSYADTNFGLTSDALKPSEGESLAYSIFGVRAKADEYSYSESNPPVFVDTHYSNIGTPATMFSLAVIPPLRPRLPSGSDYATRPDSFGKATYTLTTTFNHKPFAVQYSRADEQGILNALYESTTIKEIKETLNTLSKDIYATSRWKNLIGFDYSEQGGEFEKFPDAEHGYRFPNPDKALLFQLINNDIEKYNREETPSDPIDPIIAGAISPGAVIIPGTGANNDTTLADYIEKAVLEVFIPLTEIPLIYSQISAENDYQPINKKQVIRDRNGKLLKPTDNAYDIAPMAKRTVSGNELQFTDFTLDGTSSNIYFYAVRELSSAMQMGDFSPIIGPVNLVNTNPPIAPEIRRAIPRLADKDYGLKQIPLDFVSVENLTITDDTIVHEGGVYGGAASKQILEGNAKISYQVNAGSAIIVGLSEMHINKETETIDYGFICTSKGDVIVRDKGVLTTVGTYDSDTVLQIQRIGKILYFLRDGVEEYQIEIETPIDLLVTVSVRNKIATVTHLALYTSGRYYDKEVLEQNTSELLPLELSNLIKSTFSPEGILAKDTLIPPIDAWDSSAVNLEFIPLCGSLSFNVQSNKTVAVGLTALTEENHIDAIQYGIRTSDDGLLYVINKGEVDVQGVPYNEDSKLTIERRNQLLLFKNNGRTFYKILLEENTLLWSNYSIYSNDGTISNIEINETSNVEKQYLDTNITVPAIVLEFNSYPANQKITALSLYRTLDPAKSSSVRSMDLVKTVDVRLTGQVEQSMLTITDEFEDLLQIPYGDAIYYRATVSREVSYTIGEGTEEKSITELAPSNASRLIISTITESTNPITPEVFYDIDESAGDASGENISLVWKRMVYNPTYFVYKMNTQGNWVKIHEFESNDEEANLPLINTSLTAEELSIIDGESETVFHHFRVDVENSAGLSNITKNLITIPSDKLKN